MDRRRPSYWELELPPEPLPPRELPMRVDVLIVGAGFMGRWLAYFLGKHTSSLHVLVVERDCFTYGASSRNAGFLTCGQVSEMLADVESASKVEVIETFLQRRKGIALARREIGDFEVDECGSTDLDELTDAKRDLANELNAAAGEALYSVRASRFGGGVRPAMFNSADGGLHPVKLLRLLHSRASADYEFGVDARMVTGGTAELEVSSKLHEVEYERAFVCTNAFATQLDAASGVVPGRGQIIMTSPIRTDTERTLGYLNKGYDYFRFVGDRLLIGGGRDRFPDENNTADLRPTTEVRNYLTGIAAEVVGNRDFEVEHHWAGVMGFQNGEHLGGSPRRKLDERTEIVAGFGGMGVALTPLIAQQIAQEF